MNNSGKISNERIHLKRYDELHNRIYDCPACGNDEILVKRDVFYGRCPTCKLTLIDYTPQEHQEEFHSSSAQYKLLIGGYGTGKTTASCAEFASLALSIPNGRGLITAVSLRQVRDAVLPELEKFLPPWLIVKAPKSPTPSYLLKNGHEIIIYASNNDENLRSLNLTEFYIEEASGVDYEVFSQLTTRLRNKAGIKYNKNGEEDGFYYTGIVCSNPEDGWIKEKFMFLSDKIVGSESVDVNIYKNLVVNNPYRHYNTFLSSTRDNKYLPNGFIERTTAGKSDNWIRKYIDCYLDIREGAVYPDFAKNMVEPFPIPYDWLRIGGFDPGFNDPTAVPIGAIDPKTGITYFYTDYYVREQPISYHIDRVKELVGNYKFLYPLQADPSVVARNNRDLKSYKDYFFEKSGIVLEPGINDILFGIEKVRDYMYAGKLKFFNNLENLKNEARNYIYKDEKPIDAFNHLWDGIRYAIAKLPMNPMEMETMFYKKDFNIVAQNSKKDDATVFVGDNITRENGVVYGRGIYGKKWK